jgi:hypothetical protein
MMTNKRSIPEIRIRLQELAKENAGLDRTNAGWSEVASLAEELHRNTPIGRVKPHSQKATTELSEEIRAYKKSILRNHRERLRKFSMLILGVCLRHLTIFARGR